MKKKLQKISVEKAQSIASELPAIVAGDNRSYYLRCYKGRPCQIKFGGKEVWRNAELMGERDGNTIARLEAQARFHREMNKSAREMVVNPVIKAPSWAKRRFAQ